MQLIVVLVVALCVWSIPAFIARSKGYGFGTWYLYACFLFPIALIHAIVLKRTDAWVLKAQ